MQKKNIKTSLEITVIIVTRNRHKQLLLTLDLLSKSTFSNFEVLIIEQLDKFENSIQIPEYLKNKLNLKIVKSLGKGKSKGLNIAINLAKTPLLAFTDDDCLVDRFWLQELQKLFLKRQDVAGIFGRTIPYQPERHSLLICPSTFTNSNNSLHVISGIRKHDAVGYGNNMAFRRSLFEELGGFKEWLGPGSIGSNGEDAEIVLRSLVFSKKLLYDPSLIVKHNRWITKKQNDIQNLSYICGEIACYTYFSLCERKSEFFTRLWVSTINETLYLELKYIVHLLIRLKLKKSCILLGWWLLKILSLLRGVIVAIIYSRTKDLTIPPLS